MLYVFPCQIPISDVLVHCASPSIVPLGSVPISLPLPVNIEWAFDMDVVVLHLVALTDKAFVVDASLAVDIMVPWRSKMNLQ